MQTGMEWVCWRGVHGGLGKNGGGLGQMVLVKMVTCDICLEMVTCDICCGKFCKPLGNIISMQDPVGYPWEGCMLSHFSHKPFSLCYCLGTSVKRWEDVAWFVPTCRGQVGNVQHMER